MEWSPEKTRILSAKEVAKVISAMKIKSRRSVNARMNLVIFRLATSCGLRASEILGISLSNVRVGIDKPVIYIPKTVAKGGKQRRVPLWWDGATLADITEWKRKREEDGAKPNDPFVCTLASHCLGNSLHRNSVRSRFIQACTSLGENREVTVHDGRHTFVSHALHRGRSLAEVRDAAGHSSIATTSIYTHVGVEEDGVVGTIYETELEGV